MLFILPKTKQTAVISANQPWDKEWEAERSVLGLASRLGQKGKGLHLSLSQVNKGVILFVMRVKSGQEALSKSHGKGGWWQAVSQNGKLLLFSELRWNSTLSATVNCGGKELGTWDSHIKSTTSWYHWFLSLGWLIVISNTHLSLILVHFTTCRSWKKII